MQTQRTDNRITINLSKVEPLDPLLGHNLPESEAGPIALLMEFQAAFQNVQHLPASLNARKLVSQTGMPAQLAPDLDPVALALGRKGIFRAGSKAYAAGQAAFRIDPGHAGLHINGPFPAGLDTFSASRAGIIRHSGVLGLQESEISNLRPGTPVWASGDADGELVQRLDLPGKAAFQKLRPAGVSDDGFEVLLQCRLLEKQIGTLFTFYSPAKFDTMSFSGHDQNFLLFDIIDYELEQEDNRRKKLNRL